MELFLDKITDHHNFSPLAFSNSVSFYFLNKMVIVKRSALGTLHLKQMLRKRNVIRISKGI
jgi:hypothetical protein